VQNFVPAGTWIVSNERSRFGVPGEAGIPGVRKDSGVEHGQAGAALPQAQDKVREPYPIAFFAAP
jgi:hypothetical protein